MSREVVDTFVDFNAAVDTLENEIVEVGRLKSKTRLTFSLVSIWLIVLIGTATLIYANWERITHVIDWIWGARAG